MVWDVCMKHWSSQNITMGMCFSSQEGVMKIPRKYRVWNTIPNTHIKKSGKWKLIYMIVIHPLVGYSALTPLARHLSRLPELRLIFPEHPETAAPFVSYVTISVLQGLGLREEHNIDYDKKSWIFFYFKLFDFWSLFEIFFCLNLSQCLQFYQKQTAHKLLVKGSVPSHHCIYVYI